MKRILILANFDVGLYKFRKELIEELLNQGNEVYISLPDGALVPKLEAMGCKFVNTYVDRRGLNPKTDVKLLLFYRRLVKHTHPDLVITYTIKPNIYGGLVCRELKVPYAVNITGLGTAFQNEGILKKIVTILYKSALKKAKIIFFENVGNKQVLIEEKIVREEQTCVLNGAGVNLEEYPFCEYPPRHETRFLFIGRVMKEKGVDELFAVAEKIKKEYDNVFFDIVGPMEDDYKNRIQELVEDSIIEYHGYQEDVKPFIQKCHCFVLPSYHEGMANTNLECAASGRPLITSNIHGCLEAVEDEVNGYLCEKQNVEELYQLIKKFMMLSYNERRAMGLAGRKRMEKLFDKRLVVRETIESIGMR